MHKEKDGKFFVVQGASPAVLGMPDINNLGVLIINCEAIGRQVALNENNNNSQSAKVKKQFKQKHGNLKL